MTIELSPDDADCGDVNLCGIKMWSMSPLIVVPLINQSQLISTEESEVCDVNDRFSKSIVLKN